MEGDEATLVLMSTGQFRLGAGPDEVRSTPIIEVQHPQ